MTLTDFLLARIAEDAADADTVGKWQARERIKAHPRATFVVPRLIDCERLRAECEAKRRIVEKAADYDERWALDDVLRLLALPYSDHPDYREEWQP